ncbi:hypothetical protein G9A89_020107 [Geosiphon pyriformis]|nr:hypothetical protein G9A89_020107 [Geosiphon pyriformis]
MAEPWGGLHNGILLIKNISCSIRPLEKIPRFFPLLGKSKEGSLVLEFHYGKSEKETTAAKIKEYKGDNSQATWRQHLTFNLTSVDEPELRVRAFNKNGTGADALVGDTKIQLAEFRDESNQVITELIKHGNKAGQIQFDMSYLSSPPICVDEQSINKLLSEQKLILLLNNITCKGVPKANADVRFTLNKLQVHSTGTYWTASPHQCPYPISMEVFAAVKKGYSLPLVIHCQYGPTEFSKTQLDIGSEWFWEKLIKGGEVDTGELNFLERAFDAGSIRFKVSLHELVNFVEVMSKQNGFKTASISNTRPLSSQSSNSSIMTGFTVPEQKIACSKYMLIHRIDSQPDSSSNLTTNGKIYKGQHITTGNPVIIKIFSREMDYDNEIFYLRLLSKSNYIVRWEDKEVNQSLGGYVLVTSFHGNTLATEAGQIQDPLTRKEILLNIAKAVQFCHSQGVVLNALQPENIICETNAIRLDNFHSARGVDDYLKTVPEDSSNQMTSMCTCGFSAPEIVLGNEYRAKYEADIFSLGCVFYFTLTRMKIYDSFEDLRACRSFNSDINTNINEERAQSLLMRMLSWNSADRPKINEVVESEFFVDS